MVEYGNGLGQGPAGQVGGGSGGLGGGSGDWGGAIVNAMNDGIQQVQALPPGQLLLLIAALIIGLWVLRRAL